MENSVDNPAASTVNISASGVNAAVSARIKKNADLRGMRFGKLVVTGRGFWPRTLIVRCDCGTELVNVPKDPVRKGRKTDCGCQPKPRRSLEPILDQYDYRARAVNYGASARLAEGLITGADIRSALEKQAGVCPICTKPLANKWHVDHKKPISKGGANWPDNIQIACAPCNLRKSNREWHPKC